MKLPTITLTAARIHLGVTVPLLALFAYNAFLSRLYPFGVQAISVDRLALFVLWSLSSVASLPDRCKRPSDLFWTFYLFLSGIWGACLLGPYRWPQPRRWCDVAAAAAFAGLCFQMAGIFASVAQLQDATATAF